MFIVSNSHTRVFTALCFFSFQVGVFLTTTAQTVVAQPLPSLINSPQQPAPLPPNPVERSPTQFPSPLPSTEVVPPNTNNESPQFTRYLLGPGDVINVVFQRP